ncbi:MAG: hypothetical protein J6D02_03535 [Lachnospira sp.]|nr:hypothetical protein [Lachnospira sp.]
MNTKLMEGLIGAKMNVNQIDTPFKVFKEARHKGDTATMERAMGYVNDCTARAEEYSAEADKGLEEDAREAREKEKLELEKRIEKRREERELLEEEKIERKDADTVEVSEEGMALLKADTELDSTSSSESKAEAAEPVIYSKTGVVNQEESGVTVSVSV